MRKRKFNYREAVIYPLLLLLPMLIINSIFGIFTWSSEMSDQKNELSSMISRIEYEISQSIDDAVSISDYLCLDSQLTDFLAQQYNSGIDYYEQFNQLLQDNVIRYYYTAQSVYKITVATDNSTVTPGTYFVPLDDAEVQQWSDAYNNSDQKIILFTYYDQNQYRQYTNRARTVSVIRGLDIEQGTALLKLDVDYMEMAQRLFHEETSADIYICQGDKIIFTNTSDSPGTDFQTFDQYRPKELEVTDTIDVLGTPWEIYVTTDHQGFVMGLQRNLLLFVLIILFDILFPVISLRLITSTRQERQALVLSKKQAELNALQSQMNPHFMFNTLESIRMHSVIKGENETEEMLGRFSLLLRQASQWDRDFITIQEELTFIRSYLDIQKYRFGDRISYDLTLEKNCEELMIPKFGILAFVENACVHGIEKSVRSGYISVNVCQKTGHLLIEINDNGIGMDAAQLNSIRVQCQSASIEDLYESSHVGILNAVIRLNLYFDGNVGFSIDSTDGKGTYIKVELPLKRDIHLSKHEKCGGKHD